MRSKNTELMSEIRDYVDEYCDTNGYGPSALEVSTTFGIRKVKKPSSLNTNLSIGEGVQVQCIRSARMYGKEGIHL